MIKGLKVRMKKIFRVNKVEELRALQVEIKLPYVK
jgi:hypothetical protein